MTPKQIQILKALLHKRQSLQGKEREKINTQLIAYLAGALDGLK